ncbi:MAG: hypothetical protein ACE5MH_07215 [Terriglobia bacterium]
MRKLSVEEKERIAEQLSILHESLRDSQIDIHEFGRRIDRLSQIVDGIIEKREKALDEKVRGAGDYD